MSRTKLCVRNWKRRENGYKKVKNDWRRVCNVVSTAAELACLMLLIVTDCSCNYLSTPALTRVSFVVERYCAILCSTSSCSVCD